MLLRDTILAYLHFLSIIATVSVVVAELALCRPGLDAKRLKVLARIDLWYLFMALAAQVTRYLAAL